MGEILRSEGGALVLLPAIVLLLVSCSCGGGSEPPPAQPAAAPEPAEPAAPTGLPTEAGPPATPPAQPAGPELRLDAAADGTRVEIPASGLLAVTLESNPSTGYGWSVSRLDEAVLRLEGEPTFTQGGAPGVVGAGGTATLRLRAVAPGETDLVLGYGRPWESGVPPARTFSLHVTVR